MGDFDTYLKRLARELRKLEATQDGNGRKPARRRVLASMRLLRGAIDRSYPAIITRGKVVRLKTFEGRAARLAAKGWAKVASGDAAVYAAEGITVKHVRGFDRTRTPRAAFFAPKWAVAARVSGIAALREAKRSRNVRAEAL